MTIGTKDRNRAAIVQAIIKQNGGKIFTVVAKRKAPKVSYIHYKPEEPSITGAAFRKLSEDDKRLYSEHTDNFMTMTCRTGVTKELKGGDSTIRHCTDLISVNLTDGKGYRCFSTYNVLELRASGVVVTFKEADVLAFVGE